MIKAIIGRFQTHALSDAHRAILSRTGPKIVLLGVNPMDGREHRHPLSFRQRAKIIESYYYSSTEFRGVFPLFDQMSDDQWSRDLDKFLDQMFPEEEITLVGGPLINSFIPHYKGSRKTECMPQVANTLSGTQIRKRVEQQTGPDFLAGQIYGIENQFPRVYPVVDIGVMINRGLGSRPAQLLLIKRGDTGEWALPGGFVDPADQSLEEAARRELMEETGNNIEVGRPMYVRSFPIPDWRYRSSRDKIMSSLFLCDWAWGHPVPTPEAPEFGWWTKELALAKISPVHKPLVEAIFSL